MEFIIMPKGYGRASKEIREYITNLQQEINKLTAESTEWESKFYVLQQENKELKEVNENILQNEVNNGSND